MKLKFPQHTSEKSSNIKSYKHPSEVAELFQTDGRMDRERDGGKEETDINLALAFRNYADAPKNRFLNK
jgi:hypothetical protein